MGRGRSLRQRSLVGAAFATTGLRRAMAVSDHELFEMR